MRGRSGVPDHSIIVRRRWDKRVPARVRKHWTQQDVERELRRSAEDGAEAIRHIKSHQATAHIPIIVITAHAFPEHEAPSQTDPAGLPLWWLITCRVHSKCRGRQGFEFRRKYARPVTVRFRSYALCCW
jgi:hypothetical protein